MFAFKVLFNGLAVMIRKCAVLTFALGIGLANVAANADDAITICMGSNRSNYLSDCGVCPKGMLVSGPNKPNGQPCKGEPDTSGAYGASSSAGGYSGENCDSYRKPNDITGFSEFAVVACLKRNSRQETLQRNEGNPERQQQMRQRFRDNDKRDLERQQAKRDMQEAVRSGVSDAIRYGH